MTLSLHAAFMRTLRSLHHRGTHVYSSLLALHHRERFSHFHCPCNITIPLSARFVCTGNVIHSNIYIHMYVHKRNRDRVCSKMYYEYGGRSSISSDVAWIISVRCIKSVVQAFGRNACEVLEYIQIEFDTCSDGVGHNWLTSHLYVLLTINKLKRNNKYSDAQINARMLMTVTASYTSNAVLLRRFCWRKTAAAAMNMAGWRNG